MNAERNVLIVEGEPMTCLMLEDVLRRAGFGIAGMAMRPADALRVLDAGPVSLALITDELALTLVEGTTLLARVAGRGVIVVAASNDCRAAAAVLCRAGALLCVRKPYDVPVLPLALALAEGLNRDGVVRQQLPGVHVLG
jgi:DNA-binding NtrC family response regulator